MASGSLETWFRLAAYWVAILGTTWFLVMNFVWPTTKGGAFFQEFQVKRLQPLGIDGPEADIAAHYVGPLAIASTFAFLAVTKVPLSSWRTSWISRTFAMVPWFKATELGMTRRNQFFVGEINFNYMAIVLTFFPSMGFFWGFMGTSTIGNGLTNDQILGATSVFFGFSALVSLALFLIPVARHSVLLAAMGWNPVHAIRIHIWAGYLAFWFSMVHGVTYVPLWFRHVDEEGPVWRQVFPAKECWDWYAVPSSEECVHQFFNFTGIIAGIVFIVFVISSLNYVRRRWYRIFYILHVTFGTTLIMAIIWHWAPSALFLAPSIIYYIAATTPTLIQALASRFRGGHKIVRVREVSRSGGVYEIVIAASPEASHALCSDSCQFVKVCAPKISLIWHPLTVYKHPADHTSVRTLVRAVGPWTKDFTKALTSHERPVTIVDGFYGGANHAGQAMLHDHVTIVAGGVTITPYLSLLPNIFSRIVKSDESVATKTIVLHWACREHGLFTFIKKNYLTAFAEKARSIPGFRFEINIYHTATRKNGDKTESVASFSESGSTSSDKNVVVKGLQDSEALNDIVVHDTFAVEGSQDSDPLDDDVDTQEDSTGKDAKDLALPEGSDTNPKTKATEQGFDMELPRLLPTQYPRFWWNLPGLVTFGGLLWFGFYILFSWYYQRARDHSPDNKNKFNEIYSRLWGVLINLLVAVVFSLLAEGLFLLLRDKWPRPKLDDFETEQVDVVSEPEDGLLPEIPVESTNVSFTEIEGRPSMDQIFAGSRSASSPGIFVCAPITFAKAVKEEARLENKAFLLKTRYCIYEEPFEM